MREKLQKPSKIKGSVNKSHCVVKRDYIDKGLNFLQFHGRFGGVPEETAIEWIKYLVDNKIYFSCAYYHGRGTDRTKDPNPTEYPCFISEDFFDKVKEIAGEYFLFNDLGELGTEYACTDVLYHPNRNDGEDMQKATQNFRDVCRIVIEEASYGGKVPVTSAEQTNIMTWMAEEGLTLPQLETMVGNPEVMVPLTRSIAKHIKSDIFSTFIAHEWYGGFRQLDPLKAKRLRLVYDFCYMQGSHNFMLESGNNCLWAYDTMPENGAVGANSPFDTIYNYDHPVCKGYRDQLERFAKFLKEDSRPKGGPKVKVAFVQGNCDGYSDWRCASSIYRVFDNPDFGYSDPEFMWRILNDISTKRCWSDVHNYGEVDLSGAPAYGTFDIIPATADAELMSKYEYLIFVGWNTMTDKIYNNLKAYVKNGGRLFMTAAHLNANPRRNGVVELINGGDVSDLFGCKLTTGNNRSLNAGFKFDGQSLVPDVKFPVAMFQSDPIYSEGYINYPGVELTTAESRGKLSQTYMQDECPLDELPIWYTENKLGKGYAMLMTTTDYPSGRGYSIYRLIVRELLTASHRAAHIKVRGGDKLRFTVYEGDKVYLLNTDFDVPTVAIIDYGNGEEKRFILEPLELKPVER